MKIALVTACLAGVCILGAAGAVATPSITQTAIAGAKLGLPASAYKQLLGPPVTTARGTHADPIHPDDYSRLVFHKRKLSVYFVDGEDKGVLITTWNRRYKTAAGIGPCSTIRRAKAVYGKRLKPSKFNSQHGVVYAYTLRKNLIFASNNLFRIEVVGLYDGSDPNVSKRGGSLAYAGFITLNETPCF